MIQHTRVGNLLDEEPVEEMQGAGNGSTVVGVPVKSSTLLGQDSLLSIVQMPRGIPVATVAIGNSTNAALLAVRILGAGGYADCADRMAKYMSKQEETVLDKAQRLEEQGWAQYMEQMPAR